jgi:CheY-like chemotaxis protein
VTTRPSEGGVALTVTDDGVGMTPETRARLFEPFFTTKPVGQGTGLGLSMVHGIVRAHGGAISLDTAPGQGSTFHLYLPAAEVSETRSERAEPALPQGAGRHVLYIDDDQVMVLMVERLLQRAGFRVSVETDPTIGIERVRAGDPPFDMVVTDFNMPEMSGLDVARQIAAIRPDLPVVISSGYLSEALRDEAGRAGVRALMPKENTFEELIPLLQRLLLAPELQVATTSPTSPASRV